MKVMIAGGAGFLGQALRRLHTRKGHDVVIVDNFVTSERESVPTDAQVIHHDIRTPIPWDEPLDRIYNLACPASPSLYQRMPMFTLETCFDGTRNLLDLALQTKATLVQASTSEIYGDPQVHPQTETYRGNVSVDGPRACYDEGKRVAETLISLSQADTRVARIFNTYGPGMSPADGRVISTFAHQLLTGTPLTIFGDGSQTRSICFVDDTVEALSRLGDTEQDPGPVNIGSEYEMSILDIAELLADAAGMPLDCTFLSLPVDDPKLRKPDIEKARTVLNWSPSTSPKVGLKLTLDWHRQLMTSDETL